EKKTFLLASALNEQGGGTGLYFLQEHGGIPPTPPFRRVLAGTDGFFGKYTTFITFNILET
ncbi:MAG: hypothetical protein COT25_00495, partial [Candidatus Kerfeldbacteria bacterium CG08_land_8_20_14_0_20_42_7]